MAKWNAKYPGCSGHIHQSLKEGKDGKTNLFYDAKSPRRMSALFESYLAGQVACLMEFAPMFWPTINSYKRLVDGFWAPVKPTWGIDNRTASFRVLAGSPKATRLETRCPGADVNPYLAMAAVHRRRPARRREGAEATAPPITGTNEGARGHPARAAHADRDDAHLQAVRDRARLARRRLRRPLRRDPRLGMAPVARRRHRLGIEALLRDHLSRVHSNGHHPVLLSDDDPLRPGRAQARRPAPREQRPEAAARRHRQGPRGAADRRRADGRPRGRRARAGGLRRRVRQPDGEPGDGRRGGVPRAPRRLPSSASAAARRSTSPRSSA